MDQQRRYRGRWIRVSNATLVVSLVLITSCSSNPNPGTTAEIQERMFYAVAHRSNSAKAVERALTDGANAMEFDVRVHKGRFCANHDPVTILVPCEPLDALLDFVRTQVQQQKARGSHSLGLIFYDFKNDGGLEGAGGRLLALIRKHLTDTTGVHTLISIATLKDQRFFDGALNSLRSGEALAVDFDKDPDAVSAFFLEKGVRNFAFGDGCCVVCSCPGAKTAIERAVALREKHGDIKLIYIWTLGQETSMREFIDIGVDGIFANTGIVLGTRNDIPKLLRIVEESPRVRLAPPDYNPFP